MKLKLFFAGMALVSSGFTMADTYQSEVGLSAVRWDLDGLNSSSNNYEVNGKYYFNAVKTDNLPLAEAAYLGKNSNVFAAYSRSYSNGFLADNKVLSGGVEVYIPESFLYVKVDAAHYSYEHGIDSDNNAVTTIGLTPLNGLLVTTSWDSDESYHANIAAKYVTAIGSGHFINVEASLADTDFGTYKAIGGDFYIDNTFSVGALISDDDTGTDYTVRTRKFFSEQFSGELAYTDANFGNEVSLGVSYRF